MQDEINEKVVALSVKGAKLTAETLQKAIKAMLAQAKKQQEKQPHGKQTLKQLAKQNAGLSNIEIPLFFLLKDSAGTSMAAFAMIVVMLPCFLLAMYEKHGQPLEVVIKNVIQTKFIRPKERPYQTENFYAVIEKQRKLEKEVSAIVNGRTKNHDPRGKKSREA